MLNTTEAIAEVCMKIKKIPFIFDGTCTCGQRQYSAVCKKCFFNDNIKPFGGEGELRLNIIFRVSPICSSYWRTERLQVLNSLLTVISNRLKKQKQEDNL